MPAADNVEVAGKSKAAGKLRIMVKGDAQSPRLHRAETRIVAALPTIAPAQPASRLVVRQARPSMRQ